MGKKITHIKVSQTEMEYSSDFDQLNVETKKEDSRVARRILPRGPAGHEFSVGLLSGGQGINVSGVRRRYLIL